MSIHTPSYLVHPCTTSPCPSIHHQSLSIHTPPVVVHSYTIIVHPYTTSPYPSIHHQSLTIHTPSVPIHPYTISPCPSIHHQCHTYTTVDRTVKRSEGFEPANPDQQLLLQLTNTAVLINYHFGCKTAHAAAWVAVICRLARSITAAPACHRQPPSFTTRPFLSSIKFTEWNRDRSNSPRRRR